MNPPQIIVTFCKKDDKKEEQIDGIPPIMILIDKKAKIY